MSDTPESNDPLEALAQQLVEEAFAGLLHALPPAEQLRLRGEMLCDLRANPDGRLLLRQSVEDPAVDSSDEVRTDGVDPDAEGADKRGRSAS